MLLASRGGIQGCCQIFYSAQDSLRGARAEGGELLQKDFKARFMWERQPRNDLCECPFHRGTQARASHLSLLWTYWPASYSANAASGESSILEYFPACVILSQALLARSFGGVG